MESEKLLSARRWRNAIVLLLGIFVACALTALLLPSNVEWAGIRVPLAIATLGSLAGVAACLCAIIVVEKRRS
jgi:hypothetical protein